MAKKHVKCYALWDKQSGYVLKFYIGQFKATELCLQQRPVLVCQQVNSTVILYSCLDRVEVLRCLLD